MQDLQVLRHAESGDERQVAVVQGERRVSKQARRGLLDHPHPERLAAHRRAVKIHQHRADGSLDGDGVHRVIGRIPERRVHERQRALVEHDELDAPIRGRQHVAHAVAPHAKPAVAARLEGHEPVAAPNHAETGQDEVHHAVRITCRCFGPCTPCVSVISMSAVRLGPATTTTLLPSSSRRGSSRSSVRQRRPQPPLGDNRHVHGRQDRREAPPARPAHEHEPAVLRQGGMRTRHAEAEPARESTSCCRRSGSPAHVTGDARQPARRQRGQQTRASEMLLVPADERRPTAGRARGRR